MANGGSRETGMTTRVLAAVAIVGAIGLMLWLAAVSTPSTVATVEENEPEPAETAESVPAATFAADPASYAGRDIQLNGVTVEQMLSPELAFVSLPGGSLFLIKVAPGTVAPEQSSVVNVTGRVQEKTDSVLNAWQQSGALRSDSERQAAEFGTHFMEARRVTAAQGGS